MALLAGAILFMCATGLYAQQTACSGDCNGHGVCNINTEQCECFEGWGAASDIAIYKAPDCSLRICPSGKAWGDIPTSATAAHASAECSNAGNCDRTTGQCLCSPGFAAACPNDCSGHGRCVSMRIMATMEEAQPPSPATTYQGDQEGNTWDQDVVFGCVCDSTWAVGLGANETQEPEYFGADCSLKHCPSGDDPVTPEDETDCEGVNGGAAGNACFVECSNRGVCNHELGVCECADGHTGSDCGIQDALAGGEGN